MSLSSCPLCQSLNTVFFFQHAKQAQSSPSQTISPEYFRCNNCQLIFLLSQYFLSRGEEKSHYDTHENDPRDLNYRKFLSKLFNPMIKIIDKNAVGLDFGSGPGPTMSVMFEEHGYSMENYDYIYANDKSVLNKSYDFITSTETIEHFRSPDEEFHRIWQCLKTRGYLGLMTKFYDDNVDFAGWHYRRDPTHVCFYSRETISWLGDQLNACVVYEKDDVVILQKLDGNTINES